MNIYHMITQRGDNNSSTLRMALYLNRRLVSGPDVDLQEVDDTVERLEQATQRLLNLYQKLTANSR